MTQAPYVQTAGVVESPAAIRSVLTHVQPGLSLLLLIHKSRYPRHYEKQRPCRVTFPTN